MLEKMPDGRIVDTERKDEQSFRFKRADGVEFVGLTHSPNGTLYHPTEAGPGFHVTAGDKVWASVPVGCFGTILEAITGSVAFEMPTKDKKS